jgi:hypothetical protein
VAPGLSDPVHAAVSQSAQATKVALMSAKLRTGAAWRLTSVRMRNAAAENNAGTGLLFPLDRLSQRLMLISDSTRSKSSEAMLSTIALGRTAPSALASRHPRRADSSPVTAVPGGRLIILSSISICERSSEIRAAKLRSLPFGSLDVLSAPRAFSLAATTRGYRLQGAIAK